MLPDFARPASRTFRENEKRERRKDRHRDRDRERDPDRDRERERRRRHKEGTKERSAMTDREVSAGEAQERRLRRSRLSFSEAGPLPDIPRDVVGGWGLERTWRASLNDSNVDLGQKPSTSDLGSSRVTVTVKRPKEKGKARERERERDRGEYANVESASEQEGEYVFVEHSAQEDRDRDRKSKDKERERRHRDRRNSLGMGHASSSRLRPKDKERDRDRTNGRRRDSREREVRRSSHSAAPLPVPPPASQTQALAIAVPVSVSSSFLPSGSNAQQSALGLILVPSPDGKGYEYRYTQISGSSMDNGRAVVLTQHGQAEVHGQSIAIAPSFATSSYCYSNYSNSSSDGGVRASTTTDYPTHPTTQTNTNIPHPTRRATDPVIPGQARETSLHVPQPRRISTHIPEVDPTPEPSSGVSSGASTVVPQTQTMPPILSLDAAIAQLHLTQPQAPVSVSMARQQPTGHYD